MGAGGGGASVVDVFASVLQDGDVGEAEGVRLDRFMIVVNSVNHRGPIGDVLKVGNMKFEFGLAFEFGRMTTAPSLDVLSSVRPAVAAKFVSLED